jgi:UDP-hydrolysing UDP-N-acetyl-D-glucosamine 2-epimerase
MKKKIAILTTSRADYSLLKNLIIQLKNSKSFDVRVIVSGTHFSHKHGNSSSNITKDKLFFNKKIFLKNLNIKPWHLTNDVGKISNEISLFLIKKQIDLLLVLGDRYEVFGAVIGAFFSQVKICHIHGGEKTVGSLDDSMRHAITKLSTYHFVAHKVYQKRVMQLGEKKKNIFVVGGLGVDNIKNTTFLKKNELEKKLKIKFKKSSIVVNILPETNCIEQTKVVTKEILKALNYFKNITIIFTAPGSDFGSNFILNSIRRVVKNNSNCFFFKNLGENYLSCLNQADAIVGNSSSGILEMPTLKKITLNIGNRQKGRIKSETVIDVKPNYNLIKSKLSSIFKNKYQHKINSSSNPYGKGGATKKIIKILKKIKNNKNNDYKEFYDLKM